VGAGELGVLLGEDGRGVYLTPPGKKRRVDESDEGRSFSVKLIGAGPEIPGVPFRADINANFVLES